MKILPHTGPFQLEFDGTKTTYEHLSKFDFCEDSCGHKSLPCTRCGLINKRKGYYRSKRLDKSEPNEKAYQHNPNSGLWHKYNGKVWEWVPVEKTSLYVTKGDLEEIITTIEFTSIEEILEQVKKEGPGELCYHAKSDRWFLHQ